MPVTLTDVPADRLTEDMVERAMYARDLAPVPDIMTHFFFKTLPDAIVRPGSAAQVADVVGQAARNRVPVTPRAAASTSYYNAVPVRGGLVLDVNDLRHGLSLDPTRQTVRVLPATTWFELDDALQRQGFSVKSYPSSAVSATIGGWVSTQGHGIGSLQYGALADHLVSLQVVLPNGTLHIATRTTNPPLDWFVAAEGTLGVITEVELTVRPCPVAESHHLFAFGDLPSLGSSVLTLAQTQPAPYTVFFADAGYLALLARAGFHLPVDPASGTSGLLMASFQGEPAEVRRGQEALAHLPGRELSSDLALEEWNLRLFHLRTKRAGPSLLAAEMWLPLQNLAGYLGAVNSLARRSRQVIGTYGLAVTPGQAQVMSIYPADERRVVEYLAAIGFTKRLHDLGARYGGRPYGVGLWNTPYLSRLFSRPQLAELRRRKTQLDPAGIMNPGKLYMAPFPLWPVTFAPAAAVLGAAHTILGRNSP
jgi:glycolate oxidase